MHHLAFFHGEKNTWNECLKHKRIVCFTFYFLAAKVSIGNLGNVRPKTFWKIETGNAIFWMYLGGTASKNFFFRNKTFLFFKIESWNFQVQFEIKFRETSQNFNSFSLFRQLLFSCFLSVVWLSWNFARFHEIQFQTEPESFSLLSWKTKKFYS